MRPRNTHLRINPIQVRLQMLLSVRRQSGELNSVSYARIARPYHR